MAIDYNKFLEWAEDRFGDVVATGDEVKLNSIFVEDYKHHMWCNPSGGKKEAPYGVYHCWKSGEHGSLVNLVKKVDKCSYETALDILGVNDIDLLTLERKVEEFMSSKYNQPSHIVIPTIENIKIQFPSHTYPIQAVSSYWQEEAKDYLAKRKLPYQEYFVCIDGDYKNRIIIPYYNKSRELIYWNGRFLNDGKNIAQFKGPDQKLYGVGKSDVIYIADKWQESGATLYLTEGEFDAKSLSISGLFAGALGGKSISEKQIEIVRPYKIVLAFDADEKGKEYGQTAIKKIAEERLMAAGIYDVYYILPPEKFKDWNNMLVNSSPKLVNAYIQQNIKKYSSDSFLYL